MQNPKPLEGLMYRDFKTYDTIPGCPAKNKCKCNYTDTADTGADYLCSICYDELPEGNYVTDVLYTKKSMGIYGAGCGANVGQEADRGLFYPKSPDFVNMSPKIHL